VAVISASDGPSLTSQQKHRHGSVTLANIRASISGRQVAITKVAITLWQPLMNQWRIAI